MSDIEIGIDVSLTCDDCGAVLEHRGVRMTGSRAVIEVYRCKNCRDVEQKEHRDEKENFAALLREADQELDAMTRLDCPEFVTRDEGLARRISQALR